MLALGLLDKTQFESAVSGLLAIIELQGVRSACSEMDSQKLSFVSLPF